MYFAEILPMAQLDIAEAAAWYHSNQQGLGKKFTKEIRASVKLICKNPFVSSIRYNNIYCAVLKSFPFMIHYLVEKEINKIT